MMDRFIVDNKNFDSKDKVFVLNIEKRLQKNSEAFTHILKKIKNSLSQND